MVIRFYETFVCCMIQVVPSNRLMGFYSTLATISSLSGAHVCSNNLISCYTFSKMRTLCSIFVMIRISQPLFKFPKSILLCLKDILLKFAKIFYLNLQRYLNLEMHIYIIIMHHLLSSFFTLVPKSIFEIYLSNIFIIRT